MTRKEKVMEMEPACVNEEFEAGVWAGKMQQIALQLLVYG